MKSLDPLRAYHVAKLNYNHAAVDYLNQIDEITAELDAVKKAMDNDPYLTKPRAELEAAESELRAWTIMHAQSTERLIEDGAISQCVYISPKRALDVDKVLSVAAAIDKVFSKILGGNIVTESITELIETKPATTQLKNK